jgi:cell division protein WhiA
VRTSRSARRQLAAVQKLQADHSLADLPDRLREAAELRLRHPTASLRELAARADPRTTKASLHRRLRALEELAESHG